MVFTATELSQAQEASPPPYSQSLPLEQILRTGVARQRCEPTCASSCHCRHSSNLCGPAQSAPVLLPSILTPGSHLVPPTPPTFLQLLSTHSASQKIWALEMIGGQADGPTVFLQVSVGLGHRLVAPGSLLGPSVWLKSLALPSPWGKPPGRTGVLSLPPSIVLPGDDLALLQPSPPSHTVQTPSAPWVPAGGHTSRPVAHGQLCPRSHRPRPCKRPLLNCSQDTGAQQAHFPEGKSKSFVGTVRPAKLQSLRPCPPHRPAICLGSQVGSHLHRCPVRTRSRGSSGPWERQTIPARVCVCCLCACDLGPVRAPLETAAVPWPQVRHLECGQPGGRTNDRRRGSSGLAPAP